jgi:hypothetical protein
VTQPGDSLRAPMLKRLKDSGETPMSRYEHQ